MNSKNEINVWDLPLRIFHWLLAAGFFIAYLTEDELLNIHVGAGYLISVLLLFRLVWGFAGNRYARFSNFVCSPKQSIGYVKDLLALKSKRYIGHNPAGAAMILLLLIGLLMTCLTGFAVYGAEEAAGPLAGIGSRHEEFWEELHEIFANFTLFLVLLHVLGVLAESYLHHENLIKAMWNGRKKSDTNSD
ncbi:MAG: cytochrome b/b6 domain-containing protein [Gammaproteobacteria bacterium]